MNRRFGLRGLLVFLLLFALYGTVRDFAGTAATHNALLVFGSGVLPALADGASRLIDAVLAAAAHAPHLRSGGRRSAGTCSIRASASGATDTRAALAPSRLSMHLARHLSCAKPRYRRGRCCHF